MAGFLEIDDTQVRRLDMDMSGAPLRVQFGATRVLMGSARLVDREMREDASGHTGSYFGRGRFPLTQLPDAVSHELLDPMTAEIGLSPGGQGSLAHLLAYGSVNNGPVYDHTAGLRRATPRILNNFAEMGEHAVLGESA